MNESSLRVLMFGWEFPPYITGGLGTACHGLTTSLSKKVKSITFVLPKIKASGPAPDSPVELISASEMPLPTGCNRSVYSERMNLPGTTLKLHEIDSPLTPYMSSSAYKSEILALSQTNETYLQTQPTTAESSRSVVGLSGDYGANLIAEVIRYGRVAGHIAKTRPFDIIHAHDWMTFPAGIEAKRVSGLPLVVHVHALEFDRSGENINQDIFDIEYSGMHYADRIFAVSQRTKDMIVQRYGVSEEKVTVIHNGILPLNGFAKRKPKNLPEKLVVFLGRITMQKGPEYFLEAAHLVSKHLPNVRFAMAGSGDLLPRTIEQMAKIDLLDKFHFTGFLGEKQRNELLSMANVFVLSSVSEPFGLTPLEAIQHDVPVVVTKQSGVAEVLQSAIKVDFWDVRKTADAIINLLTEPGLAQAIVAGANRDLTNMTWDQAATKIKKAYQALA